MVSPTCIFSPDYYVETAVFQRGRKAEWLGEADSVSQQAACQRGGDKKRQTSGNGWVYRQSKREEEQVCMWFVEDLRANFWLMRRYGSSPDCLLLSRHLSDNTHLSILFFFLLSSPRLMFVSCHFKLRLSLGHVFTSNSHLFTCSDFHIKCSRDKWSHIEAAGFLTLFHACLASGEGPRAY